jgi:hypothetical protein
MPSSTTIIQKLRRVQNACLGVALHVQVLFWLSKHIVVAVAHSINC